MEAQPAFVRADRAVHLHSEAAVDLNAPLIVLPRHTEHDHAFRLNQALDDPRAAVFGPPLEHKVERFHDLLNRLVEFRLSRVLRPEIGNQLADKRRRGYRLVNLLHRHASERRNHTSTHDQRRTRRIPRTIAMRSWSMTTMGHVT